MFSGSSGKHCIKEEECHMMSMRVSRAGFQMKKMIQMDNLRIEKKQAASDSEQEKKRDKHKEFKLDEEMKKLMDAETVSNLQDVQQSIVERRVEVHSSNISESKKQKTLEHLQTIQNMAAQKMRNLRFEVDLQRRIEAASKEGEIKKAELLEAQYNRGRSIRKSEEYSKLQGSMVSHKYKNYNQKKQAVDMIARMEGTGNFVNLISH